MNGSRSVEILLRFSTISSIENVDKYCFIWSLFANLQPCDGSRPNKVLNSRQCFDEINFRGFDFTNGFKCSEVHRFEIVNNLFSNMKEL